MSKKYPVALHSLIENDKANNRAITFVYNGKPRLGIIVGGDVLPQSNNGAYVRVLSKIAGKEVVKSFSLREFETTPAIG